MSWSYCTVKRFSSLSGGKVIIGSIEVHLTLDILKYKSSLWHVNVLKFLQTEEIICCWYTSSNWLNMCFSSWNTTFLPQSGRITLWPKHATEVQLMKHSFSWNIQKLLRRCCSTTRGVGNSTHVYNIIFHGCLQLYDSWRKMKDHNSVKCPYQYIYQTLWLTLDW